MPTATTTASAGDGAEKKTAAPLASKLSCPRCDSINTKFCYYNNYNFSQPRHFCKSCRRYWTHGGTLRDIPVGGANRRGAKRSRAAVESDASVFFPFFQHHDFRRDWEERSFTFPIGGEGRIPVEFSGEGKLLLPPPPHHGGEGIRGLGGVGYTDVAFGIGRNVWPLYGGVENQNSGRVFAAAHSDGGGNSLALPEVAISTQGIMGTATFLK